MAIRDKNGRFVKANPDQEEEQEMTTDLVQVIYAPESDSDEQQAQYAQDTVSKLIPDENDDMNAIMSRLIHLAQIGNASVLAMVVNMMYVKENNMWRTFVFDGEVVQHESWRSFLLQVQQMTGFSPATYWKAANAIRLLDALGVPHNAYHHIAPTTLATIVGTVILEKEDGVVDWTSEFLDSIGNRDPMEQLSEIFSLPPREQAKAARALTKTAPPKIHCRLALLEDDEDAQKSLIRQMFFQQTPDGEFDQIDEVDSWLTYETIVWISRRLGTEVEDRRGEEN